MEKESQNPEQQTDFVDLAIKRLSHISLLFQKAILSDTILLFLFVFTQRFLANVLTLWALLPAPEVFFASLAKQVYFFAGWNFQIPHKSIICAISQAVILSLWAAVACCLYWRRLQASAHQLFTVLYSLTPIVLISSVSIFMRDDRNALQQLLGILNILVGLLMSVMFQIFSCGYSFRISNHLVIHWSPFFFATELWIRVMAISFPLILKNDSQSSRIFSKPEYIYCIFSLGRCLTSLYTQLFQLTYFSEKTAKINRLMLTLECSTAISVSLCVFIRNPLLFQNIPFMVMIIWLFSSVTFERYVSYRFSQTQLLDIQEIDCPQNALIYLRTFHILAVFEHTGGGNDSTFMSNLKKQHARQCSQTDCLCRNPKQKLQFSKMIINATLDKLKNKFIKSPTLKLYIKNYKLDYLRFYAQSIEVLNYCLDKKKRSHLFLLSLEHFKLRLADFFVEKTFSLYMADTEKVSRCQQVEQEISAKMKALAGLKKQFWEYQTKPIISYPDLTENIKEQLKIHRSMDQISRDIIEELGKCDILIILLVIYEKFVLLKQEISQQLLQNIRRMKNRCSWMIFSTRQDENQKLINNYMFGKKCCTFESAISMSHMGQILKASKNIQSIFGFSASMLEGHSINRIMPHSMRDEHDRILNHWLTTSSWDNVGIMRNIYGLDRYENCFSLKIYLKIIQRSNTINIIATCFRDNDKDFMLVNNDGIIDGSGIKFSSLLGSGISGLPLSMISDPLCSTVASKAAMRTANSETGRFYVVRQLKQQISGFKSNKYSLGKNPVGDKTMDRLKQDIRSKDFYDIEYEVLPYRIGKLNFKVLKFLSFRHRVRGDEQSTFKREKATESHPQSLNAKRHKTLDHGHSVMPSEREGSFVIDNSSMGSAMSTGFYSVENCLKDIHAMFLEPHKIKQKKGRTLVRAIWFLCWLMIMLAILKTSSNKIGFDQLERLIQLKDFSSSYIREIQLMFNDKMNLQVFEHTPEIGIQYQLAQHQQNQALKKVQHQYTNDIMDESELLMSYYDKSKQYSPYWTAAQGNTQIYPVQFMACLIGLSKKITSSSKAGADPLGISLMEQAMSKNFPQVDMIHDQEMLSYEEREQETFTFIKNVRIAKLILSTIATMACLLLMFIYEKFRSRQFAAILQEMAKISFANSQQMKYYFNKVHKLCHHANLKGKYMLLTETTAEMVYSEIQKEFDFLDLQMGSKSINSTPSISPTMAKNSLTKVLIFCVGSILFNVVQYDIGKNIMQSVDRAIYESEQLAKSKNLLINSYLDFKDYFVFENTTNRQTIERLLHDIKQKEIDLIKVQVDSLSWFHDSHYKAAVIQLLTRNMCDLAAGLTRDLEMEICRRPSGHKLLNNDLILATNMFYRSLQEAIIKQSQSQSFSSNRSELLSFHTIDRSLKFMVIVQELIQTNLENTLMHKFEQNFRYYFIIGVSEVLICLSLMVNFHWYYKWEQERTAMMYGAIYLVTGKVMKCSREMMKDMVRISRYDINKT